MWSERSLPQSALVLMVTNLPNEQVEVWTSVLHFCPPALAVLAFPVCGSLSDKQHWSRCRLSHPSHLRSALSEQSERGHFTTEPTGQMSPAVSTGRFAGSPDICRDLVGQVTRGYRQNSQTASLQSQAQWAVQTGLLAALLDNIVADFALLIHKPITLFFKRCIEAARDTFTALSWWWIQGAPACWESMAWRSRKPKWLWLQKQASVPVADLQ